MAKKANNKKNNKSKGAKKPVKASKKKVEVKTKPAKKGADKKASPKKQQAVVKAVKKEKIQPKVKAAPVQKPVLAKTIPAKQAIKKVAQPLAVETAEVVDKPTKIIVKSGPKKPEPKGKYILEYSVRSSIGILFEFISTPSGLSEWFCDNVNLKSGGFFTFFWDGRGQQAKLIGYRDQELVRFQWTEKNDGSYFEFKIQTDELTGDISLIVIDFADKGEYETNKLLWDSQINNLLHVIGSYSP